MNKNFQTNFRRAWLVIGVFSLLLPVFLPSVVDSANFARNTIGVVNVAMFVLSFPCSLFGLPVVASAAYYLDIHPLSVQGGYLNTILFFVLGVVQWFWIARICSPAEPPLQRLDLSEGHLE